MSYLADLIDAEGVTYTEEPGVIVEGVIVLLKKRNMETGEVFLGETRSPGMDPITYLGMMSAWQLWQEEENSGGK